MAAEYVAGVDMSTLMLLDLSTSATDSPDRDVLRIDRGELTIITGTIGGDVLVACESLAAEPELGDEWEQIIQLPVTVDSHPVGLPFGAEQRDTPVGELAADPDVQSWILRVSMWGRDGETDSTGCLLVPERMLFQTWPGDQNGVAVLR